MCQGNRPGCPKPDFHHTLSEPGPSRINCGCRLGIPQNHRLRRQFSEGGVHLWVIFPAELAAALDIISSERGRLLCLGKHSVWLGSTGLGSPISLVLHLSTAHRLRRREEVHAIVHAILQRQLFEPCLSGSRCYSSRRESMLASRAEYPLTWPGGLKDCACGCCACHACCTLSRG